MSVTWVVGGAAVGLLVGLPLGTRLQIARDRWQKLQGVLVGNDNEKALQQAFLRSLEARQRFEERHLVDHVRLINAMQFVIILNWDTSALLRLIGAAEEGWHRKLHARTLALSMYEGSRRLEGILSPQELSGRGYREARRWNVATALRRATTDAAWESGLDGVHGALVDFGERHRDVLNKIRNNIIGHRDVLNKIRNNIIGHRDWDVAQQLLWMRKADVDEIVRMGLEFLHWTNEFHAWSTDLMHSDGWRRPG